MDLNEQEKKLVFSQICQKHSSVLMFMRSPAQLENLIYWSLWDLKMSEVLSPFKQRKETNMKVKPTVGRFKDNVDIDVQLCLDSPAAANGISVTPIVFESDLKFYKVDDRLRKIADYIGTWVAGLYTTCTFSFNIIGPVGTFIRVSVSAGKEEYINSAW